MMMSTVDKKQHFLGLFCAQPLTLREMEILLQGRRDFYQSISPTAVQVHTTYHLT